MIWTIVLVVDVEYLVVSYGLLKGKGWARTVTVILTIIAIVIQTISVIATSMFSASLHFVNLFAKKHMEKKK